MAKKVTFQINKNIHGMKVGQTIALEVDKQGTPLDRLWRRRLKDAKIDGCISKVETQTKLKSSDTKDK